MAVEWLVLQKNRAISGVVIGKPNKN